MFVFKVNFFVSDSDRAWTTWLAKRKLKEYKNKVARRMNQDM